MPHRLAHMLDNPLASISEAVAMIAIGAIASIKFTASMISDTDWTRLTGPHGVAFLAVCGVITLWVSGIRRERELKREEERREAVEQNLREKEEERREKRHLETLALQKDNAEKLIALTAESIKANAHVTQAIHQLGQQIALCPRQPFRGELPPLPIEKEP